MRTIQPQQLHERRERGEGARLLDVRTPAEHAEVHVPGVFLMPLDRLDAAQLAEVHGFAKDEPLFVLCRSGNRAKQAVERLEKGGFTQCHVVEGGTMGWAAAGLPVNRGRTRVMSLERQVRIAAGLLVVTGVALGTWVHPGFYGLAALVGGGLVFAGITDWCGMGLLLARAPWNKVAVAPGPGKTEKEVICCSN